jgi:peptide chain release factor 2
MMATTDAAAPARRTEARDQDEKRAEMEKHYSQKGDIAFGMHIRSYVMQPYQLVKDRRTGEQTSNVQAVMDGEIDAFIEASLKGKKSTDTGDDEES